MRFLRTTAVPFAVLFLASCLMLLQPSQRRIPASPDMVARAAEHAFDWYRIPIARADRVIGIVESAAFDVYDGWNGMRLDQIVRCGIRRGPDEPLAGRVTLEIEARIDRARGRGRPVGRVGAAPTPGFASDVEVSGHGTTYDDDDEIRCRLGRDFSKRLLDRIAAEAGAGFRGRFIDHRATDTSPRGAGTGEDAGPPR